MAPGLGSSFGIDLLTLASPELTRDCWLKWADHSRGLGNLARKSSGGLSAGLKTGGLNAGGLKMGGFGMCGLWNEGFGNEGFGKDTAGLCDGENLLMGTSRGAVWTLAGRWKHTPCH
jgi:hypothetical protein